MAASIVLSIYIPSEAEKKEQLLLRFSRSLLLLLGGGRFIPRERVGEWRAFAAAAVPPASPVVDGKWRRSNSSFSSVVNFSESSSDSVPFPVPRHRCPSRECVCASGHCNRWVIRAGQAPISGSNRVRWRGRRRRTGGGGKFS